MLHFIKRRRVGSQQLSMTGLCVFGDHQPPTPFSRTPTQREMEESKLNEYIDSIQRLGAHGGIVRYPRLDCA